MAITTHVFLNIDEYGKVTGSGPTLEDLIGNAAAAEIELELEPRLPNEPRPVDLNTADFTPTGVSVLNPWQA